MKIALLIREPICHIGRPNITLKKIEKALAQAGSDKNGLGPGRTPYRH